MSSESNRIRKTRRWLDLIAYLVGCRYPVTVERIMEHVPAYADRLKAADAEEDDVRARTVRDSVRRMFERDKDELRQAGIPIESVEMSIDYGATRIDAYQLSRKDFHLPYLRIAAEAAGDRPPGGARDVELSVEESATAFRALAAVTEMPGFPLAEEARAVWRKLSFDLATPPLGEGVLFADRADTAQLASRNRAITDALMRRKRLSFAYHGIYRGTSTDRRVRPFGLFFQEGHWYLVGHDEDREDLRLFRVDRMEDPVVNARSPGTPDFEIPDDFSLASYRGRAAWELGSSDEDSLRALVHFDFPISLWADRNRMGELVREEEDGSAVRVFRVQQVDPFLRWILSRRGDARVIEPPELAEQVRQLASATLAAQERLGGPDA
ncbi:MAG: WYL domain-containing protein [Gemmatimonadota bacterium]